jgi:hypothetical protein
MICLNLADTSLWAFSGEEFQLILSITSHKLSVKRVHHLLRYKANSAMKFSFFGGNIMLTKCMALASYRNSVGKQNNNNTHSLH